ncbi:potassium channel regulatory protein [Ambystoma mexicanum]|uniref:potassium channel regulatory protein n=1 Tax=Ambystoma mexicanum TaxID=8296 RepID=UPI0037E852A3
MSRGNGGPEQPVTLNVGGQQFSTLPSTLRRVPDSRLARMVDGVADGELKPLGGGHFFLDRDGGLFALVLDYLRNGEQLCLPSGFRDYQRLQREAEFYGLPALADLLAPEGRLRPRAELLELRFLLQEGRGYFRLFCSQSGTAEALGARIVLFVSEPPQQSDGAVWAAPQRPLVPVPLQRPSHHDLVFQCGTDFPAPGEQFGARYVSIKPDQRKLINGTNVLGLLIDILLKDGFRLVSTRTVSSEEKVECYTFERMKSPDVFVVTESDKVEKNIVTQIKQTRTNRRR